MLSDRCLPLSVLSVCLFVCLSVCDVDVLWPNSMMDQDETWHGHRLQPRPACVRLDPALPPLTWGHSSLPISAHLYCGQTAAWIRVPLGMEVGLARGDIVLERYPARPPPRQKGAQPPIFDPCLLWPNGWMDQDATWYGVRPRPKPHCVRWGGTHLSHGKGHSSPPLFGPCLLWPNGRPSQQLLSSCES